MKITYGTFLKEAPGCCDDFIKKLQGYSKPDARVSPAPRATAPTHALQQVPRPFVTSGAVRDAGPTPMETNFETEEFYHAEARPVNSVNAVCRGEVDILGKGFECIVDTGASDTVLSHSVVRRLGVMDRLVPSNVSFLTAAGKTEKPMGMLPNLPVTMGSLTLHIDCMVTKANNYNVLVGNDWLRMAGADLMLSSNVLRVRLGPDQYEEIPIDTDGGPPKPHMFHVEGTEVVREAVQCLEQQDTTDTPDPVLDSESSSGSDSDSSSDSISNSGSDTSSDLDPGQPQYERAGRRMSKDVYTRWIQTEMREARQYFLQPQNKDKTEADVGGLCLLDSNSVCECDSSFEEEYASVTDSQQELLDDYRDAQLWDDVAYDPSNIHDHYTSVFINQQDIGLPVHTTTSNVC